MVQQVVQHRSKRLTRGLGILIMPGLLNLSTGAFAAGNTLRLDHDSNSRIAVENTLVKGSETTLFFWTWPDIGDPNSGRDCSLNFYSVTLHPGLDLVQPETVAREVCGGIVAKGGLLNDGDGLIIARDRLERWRNGERISSDLFSSFGATSTLRVNTGDYGAQFWDVSPSGNIAIANPVGGRTARHWPDTSLVMTGLKSDGKQLWQLPLDDVGQTYTIERLWAGHDGDALLHIATHGTGSIAPVIEPQLRYISASGKQSIFRLTKVEKQFDMANMKPGSQEDLQKFFEHQKNARPEDIVTVAARLRDGGGFDVLFHRRGGADDRAGHFLYRIGPDGSLLHELALGSHIEEHGLEDWFDFYVSGNRLVLLSTVMATQLGVNSRRKQWMQSVVSWIDLYTGAPVSRLIPLETRYLEAAMNAGDEGQQYLEGQPGGKPVKLTTVGAVPLAVSIGYINGRNTLRLNEATEDLLVFSETYDKRQNQLAKEQARKQRKADRIDRKREMNADMARAVGMTPEAFAALSNRERKEVMVRQGDPAAMQALMAKQAQAAQQAMASQQSGSSPQSMNGQLAAAMKQAQEQMSNDPNMTPETRAQMAALMAQMGQTGSAQPTVPEVASTQPTGAASTTSPATAPGNVLELDASQRGFLEYESETGRSITMLIRNRENGLELLKKDYPDGSVYEYIDFSRFGLPLQQIGVTYSESGGKVLKELTPVVAQ